MKAKNYTIGPSSSNDTYMVLNDNYSKNLRQNIAITFLSILLFFGLALFMLSNSQSTGPHWCVGLATFLAFISSIYGSVSIILARVQISLDENSTTEFTSINKMINEENRKIFKNVTYQWILIILATISIFLSFIFN